MKHKTKSGNMQLSAGFVAHQFKPGQSGNPSGHRGAAWADFVQSMRALEPRCKERLAEHLESKDPYISLAAIKIVLERGYGKPTEMTADMVSTDPEAEQKRERANAQLTEFFNHQEKLQRENAELREQLARATGSRVTPPAPSRVTSPAPSRAGFQDPPLVGPTALSRLPPPHIPPRRNRNGEDWARDIPISDWP